MKKTKETRKMKAGEVTEKEYPYLELLSDNSPHVFKAYYEEAAILDKQISSPDICNVAVVAKYGAGKSSVINTYLSLYRNKKTFIEKLRGSKGSFGSPEKNRYTRISLSTFNNNNYDETAIERSILQQLLYSRKKEKLPNSKIERTNKTSILKSLFFTFLITFTIISLVLTGIDFSLFARDVTTGGVTSIWGTEWEKFLLLGISAICIFGVIIWLLHYKKLKRIKYKDIEADMAQDDQNRSVQVTNLINKFVDEVLYFFECIDVDLVIFEDLDRLPTTEIFVKLRELNTIINNSAKRNKKVTFLYAVKDDLFKTEEERAKFFEFILPVVPVINPITSRSEIEKKIDKLVQINGRMNLSKRFIKGISTYIPDMRILKNTFNDYIMMFHKIIEDKNASIYLCAENLFALCLYKNLFPYDYALLEKNEGLIPLIIDLDKLKEKCIKKINQGIGDCNKKIEELTKDRIESFEDLKGIFISQLAKCQSSNTIASINPWDIKTFEGLDFSKVKHPIYGFQYGHQYGVALSNWKEIMTPRGEHFVDVEKRLIARERGEKEKNVMRLAELTKEKQAVLQWGFRDIVNAEGVNFCFDENLSEEYRSSLKLSLNDDVGFLKFLSSEYVNIIDKEDITKLKNAYKDFISKELPEEKVNAQINYLKFLIAQNYIDEHFIEYTSNYKATEMSPSDIKVVQAIQRRLLNFNAPVDSVKNVYDWLDDEDFKYVAILNKHIIDSIETIQSASVKNNDQKYKYFLALLCDTTNVQVYEALISYIVGADEDKIDCLVKHLVNKRENLLSDIISNDEISTEHKDIVLIAAIKYLDKFDNVICSDCVRGYVENSFNYLKIFEAVGNNEKVEKFLAQLKPKFKHLERVGKENIIQQYVISEKMYEINLDNIAFILDVDMADKDRSYFSGNFTFILAAKNEALIEYINTDINVYVKNVLLNSAVTCEEETEENIILLLNNEILSIENKIYLLSKVKCQFKNILQFSPDLYGAMFSTDNVDPSWTNIEYAYAAKGFDCVKEFIKRHDSISGTFVNLPDIKQETSAGLFKNILLQFKPAETDIVLKTLPATINLSAILSDIPEGNLQILIQTEKITYNNSDFKNLINKPKLLLEYVRVYAKYILANFDNVLPTNLSQDLIADIISDRKINLELKNKVMQKYSNYIRISGYAKKYAQYILDGNPVPTSILWQFSAEDISAITKLQILTQCNYGGVLPDNIKLKEYIMSLGESYKAMYDGKSKETRLSNNNENKQLLEFLKQNNIIRSYQKAPKQDQYIAKIANIV